MTPESGERAPAEVVVLDNEDKVTRYFPHHSQP